MIRLFTAVEIPEAVRGRLSLLQGGVPGARKTLFNRQQRYESPQSNAAIERYLAIARQYDLDPAQMALQFVTQRPFVTATILGATTMAQLETDIGSAKLAWTPELEKAIDAAHHAQPNPAP